MRPKTCQLHLQPPPYLGPDCLSNGYGAALQQRACLDDIAWTEEHTRKIKYTWVLRVRPDLEYRYIFIAYTCAFYFFVVSTEAFSDSKLSKKKKDSPILCVIRLHYSFFWYCSSFAVPPLHEWLDLRKDTIFTAYGPQRPRKLLPVCTRSNVHLSLSASVHFFSTFHLKRIRRLFLPCTFFFASVALFVLHLLLNNHNKHTLFV